MHTYIVLFTLLTFSSVALSAGLQELLNVAKCIADIHQELPNSCIYIMNSEGEEQGENNCVQFLGHQTMKVYLEIHFWK
jgi:hypothetical protein